MFTMSASGVYQVFTMSASGVYQVFTMSASGIQVCIKCTLCLHQLPFPSSPTPELKHYLRNDRTIKILRFLTN